MIAAAHAAGMTVTPWAVDEVGDAKFKTNPVCTGPWKFVSQELNANVKYERHEEYFDPARKPVSALP